MPKFRNNQLMQRIKKYKYFYLMILPVVVLVMIFCYAPMTGIRYAFYKYTPFTPKEFIGLDNFKELFSNQRFINAFQNTITISILNLVIGMFVTIFVALLLNEINYRFFKNFAQTILFLPHFISWVVVASVFTIILSPDYGVVNQILVKLGIEPIYFLISDKWWRPIYFFIVRWRDTGWSTIIYMAALSGINIELYEAAHIDGANRLKQTFYITIPCILNTILVVLILNLAKVLNLFESVFVLINPMVYDVADVIQLYTYRVGLQQADYGYSTAVGLFKSVISMVLVLSANKLSKIIKGQSIL